MTTNQQNKCQCNTMSCKIDCDRSHTHKVYSCHECEPYQQNREDKKIAFSGRRFGYTTKALLEFLQDGMNGKSVVYATIKGNFLSPKAVDQLLESTRQSAAKEAYEKGYMQADLDSRHQCNEISGEKLKEAFNNGKREAREEVLREVIEILERHIIHPEPMKKDNDAMEYALNQNKVRHHNDFVSRLILELKQLTTN